VVAGGFVPVKSTWRLKSEGPRSEKWHVTARFKVQTTAVRHLDVVQARKGASFTNRYSLSRFIKLFVRVQ